MRWQRGDIAILFLGKEDQTGFSTKQKKHKHANTSFQKSSSNRAGSAGDIIMLDNVLRKREHLLERSQKRANDEENVLELMKAPWVMQRSRLKYDNVMFKEQYGWFGGEKTENIGRFKCKMFEVSGIEWETVHRRRWANAPSKIVDVPKAPPGYETRMGSWGDFLF